MRPETVAIKESRWCDHCLRTCTGPHPQTPEPSERGWLGWYPTPGAA